MNPIKKFKPFNYKGYRVMMSGKFFIKVIHPKGTPCSIRVRSIEAAKAMVDANTENRVMTPEEYALVYPS